MSGPHTPRQEAGEVSASLVAVTHDRDGVSIREAVLPSSPRVWQHEEMLTDGEVAAGFRAGDGSCLSEAYDRWSSLVYTLALRSLGNREDAEDVTPPSSPTVWPGVDGSGGGHRPDLRSRRDLGGHPPRHGDAVPGQRGQVSVAALAPLDVPQASGTAVLRVVSASQRTITVSVANLPSEPATITRYG